jgi:hypothetical protein
VVLNYNIVLIARSKGGVSGAQGNGDGYWFQ